MKMSIRFPNGLLSGRLATLVALSAFLALLLISTGRLGAAAQSFPERDNARVPEASARSESEHDRESSRRDFVAALPALPAPDSMLARLKESSKLSGATLVSTTVALRDATERTLGRAEVSIVARGTFAGVKALISDLQVRSSAVIVQRLSLRQLSPTQVIEARIDALLVAGPSPGASASH